MEIRESEKAAAGYRSLKLIGLAHGAGLAIYVSTVEWLGYMGVNASPTTVDLNLVRTLLLLVSVALFFLAGRLRERVLVSGLLSVEQALVPGARVRHMIAANLVVFALCDLTALFGLVLFLLGGTRQEFYVFVILALIFFAIRFPRPAQWQTWYAVRGQMR
jgi:hypothetical protein